MLYGQLPDFEIVDFHGHFPTVADDITGDTNNAYIEKYGTEKLEIIKRDSAAKQKEWRKAWGFPDPEDRDEDIYKTSERWLYELDKYNISKIVFTTGGGNDTLHKVISTNPHRFIGFAHHNPFSPGAAEELEKCILEYGFKGYKILAPTLTRSIADESLALLWEVCEKYSIPVLIHFGVLGGGGGIANGINIDPLVIHDVAKAYPKIPFVIPHFGCCYPGELLRLCWVCSNVYVDTSGNNEWVRWMPYSLTLDDLFRKFYETIGPERIIFGTDSEWFPRGYVVRYLLDQLRVCYGMKMPGNDMKKIFGGNARRLLKLQEGDKNGQ